MISFSMQREDAKNLGCLADTGIRGDNLIATHGGILIKKESGFVTDNMWSLHKS